jgi:hypothetical protein
MMAAETIIPPLTFTLPAGFRQLPLDGDAEEREAAVRKLAAEVYPLADGQIRDSAAAIYDLMAGVLSASGVEFAAFGLFDDGDGGVAHCSLTVAALPSDHASAEVAANGIKEIFIRDPLRDTQWLDLVFGPAVAVISVTGVPVGHSADSDVRELPIGQIQVHVPFPHDPWIALFTLETTAMEQWDDICGLMATVVKSISFDSERGITIR